MGDILEMSQKELLRLEIIQRVIDRRIKQTEAAKLLNLSYRQAKRLVEKYRKYGAEGLVSKKRRMPSNRRLTNEFKAKVNNLVKTTYYDFGPTFAAEKLKERDGFVVSKETLRQWMIEWGLWKAKRHKTVKIHQQRERRSCFGELVQIDGSPHDWFEGRSKPCCLIAFIDDATSKAIQLRFVLVENTQAYFACAKKHFKHYGRPFSYYSDRHSIFRVNYPNALKGQGETQFERAMRELGIQTINANSPQAKGRVERHNRTLQDRLIKEMRLQHISDIDTANDFLETFIKDYNQKFGKVPANKTDMHQKTIPKDVVLDVILSERYSRKLSKNLEFSFRGRTYQIIVDKGKIGYGLQRANVMICKNTKGEMTVWYKDRCLNYREFKASKSPSEVVSSKEINAIVDQNIASKRTTKPSLAHPWKRQSFLKMVAKKNQLKSLC